MKNPMRGAVVRILTTAELPQELITERNPIFFPKSVISIFFNNEL